MPATDQYPSFLGRISSRQNQELEDLELFQKHVANGFVDLLSPAEEVASTESLLPIS